MSTNRVHEKQEKQIACILHVLDNPLWGVSQKGYFFYLLPHCVIYIQDYSIDICVSHYYLLLDANDLFKQPLNVQKIRRKTVACVILSEDKHVCWLAKVAN